MNLGSQIPQLPVASRLGNLTKIKLDVAILLPFSTFALQIFQFSSDGQVWQVPAKFEYLQNPSTHIAAVKMFSSRWKILQHILMPAKCFP